MLRLVTVALVTLLLTGCAHEAPQYPPDAQSMDAPKDPGAIVEIPQYPESGRSFAIQRSTGPGNLLKVADQNGLLEIWQGSQQVTSITLGPCFSFSRMNATHDFGSLGKPEYATAPPDCRVWDGRRWNESFKTKVPSYLNPCLYEGNFVARVRPEQGDRIVDTKGDVQGVILDNGQTFQFKTQSVFDDKLQFFRWFDVGYVGTISVLNEVK